MERGLGDIPEVAHEVSVVLSLTALESNFGALSRRKDWEMSGLPSASTLVVDLSPHNPFVGLADTSPILDGQKCDRCDSEIF